MNIQSSTDPVTQELIGRMVNVLIASARKEPDGLDIDNQDQCIEALRAAGYELTNVDHYVDVARLQASIALHIAAEGIGHPDDYGLKAPEREAGKLVSMVEAPYLTAARALREDAAKLREMTDKVIDNALQIAKAFEGFGAAASQLLNDHHKIVASSAASLAECFNKYHAEHDEAVSRAQATTAAITPPRPGE